MKAASPPYTEMCPRKILQCNTCTAFETYFFRLSGKLFTQALMPLGDCLKCAFPEEALAQL